jgi:dGTPase
MSPSPGKKSGRGKSLSPSSFAIEWQEREARELSPRATRSYPAKRSRPEPDNDLRTPFQRDRDRIVHCKAFRRLMHKTQVFIAPEGDHFRTRLTHTLEVTGIARTVARALRLNEDLTEAIGLGHDLGHTPFGHLGEEALDEVSQARGGPQFRHYRQSVRIVEKLERDGRGLNLNAAVIDGIRRHSGTRTPKPKSLEGQIVRLVDRVAYINHDIDDAIRAGVIRRADLPSREIAILGESGSARIDALVKDIVESSLDSEEITQSPRVGGAMEKLRDFMFAKVYASEPARKEKERIGLAIETLFDHYVANPDDVTVTYAKSERPSDKRRAIDMIAGMTDRFCIATYEGLVVPRVSRF